MATLISLASKSSRQSALVSLLVLSGEITVKYDGGSVVTQKGGSILVPQVLKVLLNGKAEVICSKENQEIKSFHSITLR